MFLAQVSCSYVSNQILKQISKKILCEYFQEDVKKLYMVDKQVWHRIWYVSHFSVHECQFIELNCLLCLHASFRVFVSQHGRQRRGWHVRKRSWVDSHQGHCSYFICILDPMAGLTFNFLVILVSACNSEYYIVYFQHLLRHFLFIEFANLRCFCELVGNVQYLVWLQAGGKS